MIKRWIEHREYQQLRRDRMQEKKFQQAGIVILVGLGLLFAIGLVTKEVPTETKPVAAVSTPVVSQEAQDIERFADVVTKPVETLTSDDLDFVDSKAGDPCYERNASLPREAMISAITDCKTTQ